MEDRILELSKKYNLSHLGSCLTSVKIIDYIYSIKEKDDIFILSNGHAGLALYVILEKYLDLNAEELFLKYGVHPVRDIENGIYCTTGSLGLGLSIAIGEALSNKDRKVYVLISDGECAEGIVWESLAFIKKNKIDNIEVFVNANGYGAYCEIEVIKLFRRLHSFLPEIIFVQTDYNDYNFLNGMDAHYYKLKEDE